MDIVYFVGGPTSVHLARGLLASVSPYDHNITLIANTTSDLTVHGLRACPDIDAALDAGATRRVAPHTDTFKVSNTLEALDSRIPWYPLSDADFAHLVLRSQMLALGYRLTEFTQSLSRHMDSTVTVLPVTDDYVETHVVINDGTPPATSRAVHIHQWDKELQRVPQCEKVLCIGLDKSHATPEVLDAIHSADSIVLPPSNPLGALGPMLSVPGVRDAITKSSARVIGVSSVGTVDAYSADNTVTMLESMGMGTQPSDVLALYADILNYWIVAPEDLEDTTRQVAGHAAVKILGAELITPESSPVGELTACLARLVTMPDHG